MTVPTEVVSVVNTGASLHFDRFGHHTDVYGEVDSGHVPNLQQNVAARGRLESLLFHAHDIGAGNQERHVIDASLIGERFAHLAGRGVAYTDPGALDYSAAGVGDRARNLSVGLCEKMRDGGRQKK